MASFKTLDTLDAFGKRIFVRLDLNLPTDCNGDGRITDFTRLQRSLPTLQQLIAQQAKVIILSHFKRPGGQYQENLSFRIYVKSLSNYLGHPIKFIDDCIGDDVAKAVSSMKNGDVILLENVRFHAGEESNCLNFLSELAQNGDVYVNDAFSVSHRAHASTEGIARILPCYAGKAVEMEVKALDQVLGHAKKPVMAVVGGAKIGGKDGKLTLLKNLIDKVDKLVIGGAMANTFLAAQGNNVGQSRHETGDDVTTFVNEIMVLADQKSCELLLPTDCVVAEKLEKNTPTNIIHSENVDKNMMILDAGPESCNKICAAMEECQTLLWNGPLGVFEVPPFDEGTCRVAQFAAQRTRAGLLISVAGGGDTISALNHAGVDDDFSYISTAGGAFLEWLEGKTLPGIAVLYERNEI